MKLVCKNIKEEITGDIHAGLISVAGKGTFGILEHDDNTIHVIVVGKSGNIETIDVTHDALIFALRDAGIISRSEGMTSEEEREYAAAMEKCEQ